MAAQNGLKTVILAGGLGTRLSEETVLRPKPMVEIGGHPILWHIMNIYAAHGFTEFLVAGGYKGEVIKEYFCDFWRYTADVQVDLRSGKVDMLSSRAPDWRVTVVDTGHTTQTGGRLKRLEPYIGKQTFMLTYGDGLSDVNIQKVVEFHKSRGKLATITAARPPARFGGLSFDGDRIVQFSEKPQIGEGWINGGFMIMEPQVLDYIEGDETILERGPLERLADDGQLVAYRHEGFWQPMDTIREKLLLESLWQSGKAPWKVW